MQEDTAGHGERRGHNNDVLVESGIGPVTISVGSVLYTGIGNSCRKALAPEEISEPAPHLAGTANHERAASVTLPFGNDAIALLARQRGFDELGQDRFGELRVETEPFGLFPAYLDHFFFARVIARRRAAGLLVAPDFADDFLASRNEFDQLPVDVGELAA